MKPFTRDVVIHNMKPFTNRIEPLLENIATMFDTANINLLVFPVS